MALIDTTTPQAIARRQAAEAKLGLLRPATHESVTLADGKSYGIQSVSPAGQPWMVTLSDTAHTIENKKPVTSFDREPHSCFVHFSLEYLDGIHVHGSAGKIKAPAPIVEVRTVNRMRTEIFCPTTGEVGNVVGCSTRRANPWVLVKLEETERFLTIDEMHLWAVGKQTLLEKYVGNGKQESYSWGLLVRNTSTGAYALTEPEFGQLYFLTGALCGEVGQANESWVIAGTRQRLSDLNPTEVAKSSNKLRKLAKEAEQAMAVPGAARSPSWRKISGIGKLNIASAVTVVPGAAALALGAPLGAEIALGALVLAAPARHAWTKVVGHRSARAVTDKGAQEITAEQNAGAQLRTQVLTARELLGQESSQMLEQVLETGTYLTKNADRLPAEKSQEAQALLNEHLPTALRLYAEAMEHSQSAGARSQAESRLMRQLHLIAVEAHSVRAQIEQVVSTSQDEFGRFLDAKLRRSDLD